MNKISVLLADDHKMLREGLKSILEREADIIIVGEAEDGHTAIKLTQRLNPDVVVLDIAMPKLNGLDAARQIHQILPNVRIIMLTMYDSEEYIRQALASGAMGYILKDDGAHELIEAIRTVFKGEAVLSPAITTLVIANYLRWGDLINQDTRDSLSSRERQILQLIAEGYTNKQIGEILCISIKTVQSHRLNLMKKLDIHDRGELIKYAIQKKIIDI